MKKIAQDSHQLNSSYLIILIRSRNIVYLKGIGFYTACQAIPVNAMVESICAKCLPKESLRCSVFTFRKIETLIFIPLTGKKFIIPFSSLQVEYFPTVDGFKVTLYYAGQQPTCGRCHQVSKLCKGGGIARKCEIEGGLKVEFKDYICGLWNSIGYSPNLFIYLFIYLFIC